MSLIKSSPSGFKGSSDDFEQESTLLNRKTHIQIIHRYKQHFDTIDAPSAINMMYKFTNFLINVKSLMAFQTP